MNNKINQINRSNKLLNLSKTNAWGTWIHFQELAQDNHDCKYGRDNGCNTCQWLDDSLDNLILNIKHSGLMTPSEKGELLEDIERSFT